MESDLRRWIRLVESVAHDGDSYFDMNDANSARNAKSRETLVYMSPSDFLKLAEKGHDPTKETRVTNLLQQGVKFNALPMILFIHDGNGTAKVVGHEGRHRARALRELNVKQMPVILKSIEYGEGKAIRWGSQDNKFDHVDHLPTVLTGEDSDFHIPMPRSVFYPLG